MLVVNRVGLARVRDGHKGGAAESLWVPTGPPYPGGRGWQLATHAVGDRAIDEVLDSYAATVKALDLQDARFRVVHFGVSTPAIQERLRQLQVLVDGNPAFVYWISDWFEVYGAERVRWSYPGKSYVDNGIIADAGSDGRK